MMVLGQAGIPPQVSSFAQLMAWQMMSEMAEAISEHTDAAEARLMAKSVAEAYSALYLVAVNGTYMYDGQGSDALQVANSMALYLGVPQGAGVISAVVQSLVSDIEKRGHNLSTGTIGTLTLFEALSAHNHTDTAYKVAVSTTRMCILVNHM